MKIKILLSGIGYLGFSLLNLIFLYGLLACPPMHWVYDPAPPAGASSVYVPGSGFSGFWFHLGALQAIPNLHDYDFYCYSSGCLSVVMAAMNVSVQDALASTLVIQQSWLAGNISRFELVDTFLDDMLGDSDNKLTDHCDASSAIDDFLPHLNILVTSRDSGVKIVQPTSRWELANALKQTTWIPFVTGEGLLRHTDESSFSLDWEEDAANTTTTIDQSVTAFNATSDQHVARVATTNDNDNITDSSIILPEEEFYLDGGFSRMLHPICQYDLRVPLTWINMIYTLHPGLSQQQVNTLWQSGRNFDHPLLLSY